MSTSISDIHFMAKAANAPQRDSLGGGRLENSFIPGNFNGNSPAQLVDNTITLVDTVNDEFTVTFGGISTGTGPIKVFSTGDLPEPLSSSSAYWAITTPSPTIIKLAASKDDALEGIAIDITTAGTGTIAFNYLWDMRYSAPASGPDYIITALNIFIEDVSASFLADDYGGITGGLIRGIQMYTLDGVILQDNVIQEITNLDFPIRTNADLCKWADSVEFSNFASGNNYLKARIDFKKLGAEIFLKAGWCFHVGLFDDFSGLINHNFTIEGYKTA